MLISSYGYTKCSSCIEEYFRIQIIWWIFLKENLKEKFAGTFAPIQTWSCKERNELYTWVILGRSYFHKYLRFLFVEQLICKLKINIGKTLQGTVNFFIDIFINRSPSLSKKSVDKRFFDKTKTFWICCLQQHCLHHLSSVQMHILIVRVFIFNRKYMKIQINFSPLPH